MNTVIVNFVDDATEAEIKEFMRSNSLRGTRVSMLKNKYAIDLPQNAKIEDDLLIECIF